MKIITLTGGKVSKVDNKDYKRLNRWPWFYSNGHALRNIRLSNNKPLRWYMHWDIIGRPNHGLVVDHINGDGLDNRTRNLRICTQGQNRMNSTRYNNNTSGYKGVHYYKKTGKFASYVCVKSKKIHLGYFDTAKNAAIEYNKAAKRYHKKFCRLNVIRQHD